MGCCCRVGVRYFCHSRPVGNDKQEVFRDKKSFGGALSCLNRNPSMLHERPGLVTETLPYDLQMVHPGR